MEIKAQKYQGNYHRFNIPKSKEKKAWLFTCSDVHFDNPKCDRKLFFKHMDLAIERGAMIAITGDLFCLMQGKYDPRGSKSNVRPEHNKAKNHDSFVLYSNNLSDLSVLQSMCVKVGLKSTMYSENEKRGTSRLNVSTRNSTFFAHGRYNKVPYSGTVWCVNVNNGTLVVRRNGCVMVTQNTHDGWIVTHPRLRKNHSKRTVDVVNQWHIKTGTYKEEYGDGSGWAVERIAMPKYLGGCFTEFNITKHGVEFTPTLTPNANIR